MTIYYDACWITTATNIHSEYAILIAFVWEQWLHEHASVLHHMNIKCLSCSYSVYYHSRYIGMATSSSFVSVVTVDTCKQSLFN